MKKGNNPVGMTVSTVVGIWVGMAVYTVYIDIVDVTTDVGMDVGNGCRE